MNNDNLTPQSLEPQSSIQDIPDTPQAYEPSPSRRPSVTFMGNNYDLTSLAALASGLLMLFLCLTCNMGIYCLPFFPILLGIVGLIAAGSAVNQRRTRLWSWIGLGTGGAVFLMVTAAVILYIGFVILVMIAVSDPGYNPYL